EIAAHRGLEDEDRSQEQPHGQKDRHTRRSHVTPRTASGSIACTTLAQLRGRVRVLVCVSGRLPLYCDLAYSMLIGSDSFHSNCATWHFWRGLVQGALLGEASYWSCCSRARSTRRSKAWT